ncbi:hypothetical protein A2U01_0114533, partial [Trifolium medium]|nr:hypothetical protein [Trifolium medium]
EWRIVILPSLESSKLMLIYSPTLANDESWLNSPLLARVLDSTLALAHLASMLMFFASREK